MASGGCYGPPLVPRDLLWHGIDAAAAIEASSCASSKANDWCHAFSTEAYNCTLDFFVKTPRPHTARARAATRPARGFHTTHAHFSRSRVHSHAVRRPTAAAAMPSRHPRRDAAPSAPRRFRRGFDNPPTHPHAVYARATGVLVSPSRRCRALAVVPVVCHI